MTRPWKELRHTAGYVVIQILSAIPVMLAIRFGTEHFSLRWILGSLLALGWGTTGYAIMAPTIAAAAWTNAFADFQRTTVRALVVAAGVAAIAAAPGWAATAVSGIAGLPAPWVACFFLVGAARAAAQIATTYPIRDALHGPTLRLQLFGRVAEIVIVAWSAYRGIAWMFAAAWLAYPAAQAILVVATRQTRAAAKPPAAAGPVAIGRGVAVNVVSLALDFVLPTLWLRLAGEVPYVVYRAVAAAIANTTVLPRFWYVVSPSGAGPYNFLLGGFAIAAALVYALVYLLATDVVSYRLILWAAVPIVGGGLASAQLSRLRQQALRDGDIIWPAGATALGHIAEACVLLIFIGVLVLPPEFLSLAYLVFPVTSLLVMRAVRT